MKDNKELKQKAALAAVMMFIDEEMAKQSQCNQNNNDPSFSSWGQYGRQAIMSNRGMMQLRLRKR